MTPPPADEPASFDKVQRMLGEIQYKHFELAQMVGEYLEMIGDLEERYDSEKVRLARVLPGAKYFVQSEYVRQQWLVLGTELKKLFPDS